MLGSQLVLDLSDRFEDVLGWKGENNHVHKRWNISIHNASYLVVYLLSLSVQSSPPAHSAERLTGPLVSSQVALGKSNIRNVVHVLWTRTPLLRPQQRHAIATLVIIDPHERSTVSWKEPVLEYSEEHRLIRLSSPSDGFSELFNEEYQWSHAVEEYPITQRQRSSIEQWLKE